MFSVYILVFKYCTFLYMVKSSDVYQNLLLWFCARFLFLFFQFSFFISSQRLYFHFPFKKKLLLYDETKIRRFWTSSKSGTFFITTFYNINFYHKIKFVYFSFFKVNWIIYCIESRVFFYFQFILNRSATTFWRKNKSFSFHDHFNRSFPQIQRIKQKQREKNVNKNEFLSNR